MTLSSRYLVALFLCLGLCSCSTIQAPYKKVKVWNERRVIRNAQESEDAPKIFDGEVEPRMPSNWDNDSTLPGIDANNNGVRDDVEIWINRRWKSSGLRKAFKQYARAIQKMMANYQASDSDLRDVATNTYSKAYLCLSSNYSKTIPFHERDDEIETMRDQMVYSSWERIHAWNVSYDRARQDGFELFHGGSYNACDF